MESFFTFPDRALKYDCPSCGSFCCKGKGVALEASQEVVRFARLEPRMAALVYPADPRYAHGIEGDPRLETAARFAARQASLLTCSWRLYLLLSSEAAPYPGVIRLLPRQLLAAAHLVELSHLGRKIAPGLRAATETFQGTAPLIGLLAVFPQQARLKTPLELGVAVEVQPALVALSRMLLEGGRTLAEAVELSLSPFPLHLRSMALTALAFGNAELLVE